MHALANDRRSLVMIRECCKVALLSVALVSAPLAAHAGGAKQGNAATGVSASGSDRMSAARRAELEAQIRLDSAKSASKYRQLDNIEDAIAVAKLVDVTIGFIAGIVAPKFGGAVYSFSKAITFAAFGQYDEALSSTVSAVTSVAGSVTYNAALHTTDVTLAVVGSAVKAAADAQSWSNNIDTAADSLNELAN